MSTIRDVAKLAGVSVTTVSQALSGNRHVAPATRVRIQTAVKQLHYQPSQSAITMLTGRSATIGALVPDIKNPFFGELLSAVEGRASEFGYGTIVCSTELRQDEERRQIKMLCSKQVDIILLIGCSDTAATHVPQGNGAPMTLLVDQSPDVANGLSVVRSDHTAGGKLAADHLHNLGHRRVGVIAGPSATAVSTERLTGFLTGMAQLGTRVPKTRQVAAAQFTTDAGRVAALELLQRQPTLTGLFCSNDLIAYGALHAATELGLRVPEDLSVMGFDDIFVSAMIQPTLTTIRQDIPRLGARAVEIALELLTNPGEQRIECLDVSLIERASTGAPTRAPRTTLNRRH